MLNNLYQASHQWATRPADERFLSLEELHEAVAQRYNESWTTTSLAERLRVQVDEETDELGIQVYNKTNGQDVILRPTHWSFSQLCQYANAPAKYLRSLPATLTGINLQYGLEFNPIREDSLILGHTNGSNLLRSITSTSYGRIWDQQVVEAVQRVNVDGRWQIPAASYASNDPKRATTLYASDRDVFIFLVDPDNPIEVPGEEEPLFRGFFTWNSEVGSAVFGLTTFLYRYVCDNRIIWGATDVKELRIKHTGGAPDRFAYEGRKYLERYANESVGKIVDGIVKAEETPIPVRRGDTVQQWLQERGFTKKTSDEAVKIAILTEHEPRSIWDVVNGITRYAQTIQHTDARVELERKGSDLMKYAVN